MFITELRFTADDADCADFSSFRRTSQSENAITVGWTFLSDHPSADGFTVSNCYFLNPSADGWTGRNAYPTYHIIFGHIRTPDTCFVCEVHPEG
ncbi:MAG: hypothetical protein HN590_07840 [Calditrichaeota bacterium]|nr:hypothetical protein [Calditrichota bacterium]MBT7790469.1 hypothetical protein [Calditrichota bacterium]